MGSSRCRSLVEGGAPYILNSAPVVSFNSGFKDVGFGFRVGIRRWSSFFKVCRDSV